MRDLCFKYFDARYLSFKIFAQTIHLYFKEKWCIFSQLPKMTIQTNEFWNNMDQMNCPKNTNILLFFSKEQCLLWYVDHVMYVVHARLVEGVKWCWGYLSCLKMVAIIVMRRTTLVMIHGTIAEGIDWGVGSQFALLDWEQFSRHQHHFHCKLSLGDNGLWNLFFSIF